MAGLTRPLSGRTKGSTVRDVGAEYRRTIGRWIAERREKAGLTQKQLGKLVGIEGSAVSAIELGRNPVPPERYMDFATVLKVHPRTFGMFLLEYSDPWLFGMIYGQDKVAKHHLEDIPERLMDTRAEE